jgi:hypothetical protein
MADISSDIMAQLSNRLTSTVPELAKALQRPEQEIDEATQKLESEQMIHLTADAITKVTFISPTGKGLLAARGLSKYAFK